MKVASTVSSPLFALQASLLLLFRTPSPCTPPRNTDNRYILLNSFQEGKKSGSNGNTSLHLEQFVRMLVSSCPASSSFLKDFP